MSANTQKMIIDIYGRRKWKKAELARSFGITRRCLYDWMDGKYEATGDNFRRLQSRFLTRSEGETGYRKPDPSILEANLLEFGLLERNE